LLALGYLVFAAQLGLEIRTPMRAVFPTGAIFLTIEVGGVLEGKNTDETGRSSNVSLRVLSDRRGCSVSPYSMAD